MNDGQTRLLGDWDIASCPSSLFPVCLSGPPHVYANMVPIGEMSSYPRQGLQSKTKLMQANTQTQKRIKYYPSPGFHRSLWQFLDSWSTMGRLSTIIRICRVPPNLHSPRKPQIEEGKPPQWAPPFSVCSSDNAIVLAEYCLNNTGSGVSENWGLSPGLTECLLCDLGQVT